ncbi:MAG: YciI family protein [Actinomycetota bacterium]|nr:YciI family protein [Actinomycetota bacterium]
MSAPREFDHYALVLLRRPSDAPDLPEAELDRLQEEHLAYLASLRDRGLLVAGPFRDQPDEALRGMCLFRLSLDEARVLMEQDPAVRAGRLAVDVLTWLTAKGALRLGESESS